MNHIIFSTRTFITLLFFLFAINTIAQESNTHRLETGWYYVVKDTQGIEMQLDKSNESYTLNPVPIVTASNITTTEVYTSIYGDIGLSMRFDKQGTKAWSLATENAIGMKLGFVVNNKLVYTPIVNGQITVGVSALNRGETYTKDEIEDFKAVIDSQSH